MDYKILKLIEIIEYYGNKNQEETLVNLIYNHFHKNWNIIENEKDNLEKQELLSLRKNNLEGILYFLEEMNNEDEIVNKFLTANKTNYLSQLINNQYFGDNSELSYRQICDKEDFLDLIIKMEEIYIKNNLSEYSKNRSKRVL